MIGSVSLSHFLKNHETIPIDFTCETRCPALTCISVLGCQAVCQKMLPVQSAVAQFPSSPHNAHSSVPAWWGQDRAVAPQSSGPEEAGSLALQSPQPRPKLFCPLIRLAAWPWTLTCYGLQPGGFKQCLFIHGLPCLSQTQTCASFNHPLAATHSVPM